MALDTLHSSKAPSFAPKQDSVLDAAAGKGLIVGAFGLGARTNIDGNLDDWTAPGFYYTGGAALNEPIGGNGYLFVESHSNLYVSQTWTHYQSGRSFKRVMYNGTWGSWSEIFSQSNIVGAVSQSSGAPAGAIIEYGSNANGEFTKFADGTMVVTGNRTSFTSGGSVTLAASFANVNYRPFANLHVSGSASANAYSLFNGSMNLAHSSAAAATISFLAIGRWF